EGPSLPGCGMLSRIDVWSVADGKRLLSREVSLPDDGKAGCPVVFSPDGHQIATASKREVVIWPGTILSGMKEKKLTSVETISNVAWSPDSRLLAGGNVSGMVQLWDVTSGQEVCRFTGHRGRVVALAFTRNGLRLASGSDDTTVLIWDLRGLQQY